MNELKITNSHISGTTASAFEEEIQAYLNTVPESKRLFLDFSSVEYISSAGLRVLLQFVKTQKKKLTILNVKSNVREIFSITGMDSIISVHAPFREISVKDCKELGHGWYGTVYRLDEDKIVKIYNDNPANSLDNIEEEREVTKQIYLTGLPCAVTYDLVRTEDGKIGAVYEFLNGKTIFEMIEAHPEKIEEYAWNTGKLLRKVHAVTCKPGEIQSVRDYFEKISKTAKKEIPLSEKELFTEFTDKISQSCNLLHGDYNSGNVMLCDGEYVLIDIGGAFLGHPLIELASRFPFALFNPAIASSPEADNNPEIKYYRSFISSYFEDADKEKTAQAEEMIKATAAFLFLFNYYIFDEEMPGGEALYTLLKTYFLSVYNKIFPINEWWPL